MYNYIYIIYNIINEHVEGVALSRDGGVLLRILDRKTWLLGMGMMWDNDSVPCLSLKLKSILATATAMSVTLFGHRCHTTTIISHSVTSDAHILRMK